MSPAADDHISISSNGGSRPIPDPTLLTDKAIDRATEAIHQYIDGQLAVRDERLSGIDEATRLRLVAVETVPSQIDEKVGHLADLTTERFNAAERLRVEQKKDTKDAVDAALSAAKEAVKEQTTASERSIAKSEGATSKQLDQIQETFTTAIDGLRRSIDDLKEARAEDGRQLRQSIADVVVTTNGSAQRTAGGHDATDNTRLWMVAGFGGLAAVSAVIFGIIAIVKP